MIHRWLFIFAIYIIGFLASIDLNPFFIQDPADRACLGKNRFQACSVDTLWRTDLSLDGTIRIVAFSENQDERMCLSRSDCKDKHSLVTAAGCDVCGSLGWSISEDDYSSYEIYSSNGIMCLVREGSVASVFKCSDQAATKFSIKFLTEEEVNLINNDGSLLIAAALDDEARSVISLLSSGVDINYRAADGSTALMAACSVGNINIAKILISGGVDPDIVDDGGFSALMEGCIIGNFEIVKLLVDPSEFLKYSKWTSLLSTSAIKMMKADIQLKTHNGVSAFWLACAEGRLEIVEYLISKKASIRDSNGDGVTCLIAAASGGHSAVVKSLVLSGADVNEPDNEGHSALMAAIESGSLSTISALIVSGADPNVASKDGFTPLIMAAASGNQQVVKYLLDHSNVNVNQRGDDVDSLTALMYSAASGSIDILRLLISHGADFSLKHRKGGSVLTEACSTGNIDILRELVEVHSMKLADVDDEDLDCFLHACIHGYYEIVEYILEQENSASSIDKRSKFGASCIMYASYYGHLDILELISSHGASISDGLLVPADVSDSYTTEIKEEIAFIDFSNGTTSLMLASHSGNQDIVIKLLSLFDTIRDKLLLKNINGESALTLALDQDHLELANMLLQSILCNCRASDFSVTEDDKEARENEMTDYIYRFEPACQIVDIDGSISHPCIISKDLVALLHSSIASGKESVVKRLLLIENPQILANSIKSSISPDRNKRVTHTPLTLAVGTASSSMVSILLAAGADPNIVGPHENSPLMIASGMGLLEIAKILIEHNADRSKVNTDGHKALQLAMNGLEMTSQVYSQFYPAITTNAYGEHLNPEIEGSLKSAVDDFVELIDMLLALEVKEDD